MSDKISQGGTPTECRFKIASVRLLNVPFHVDRDFDYRVIAGADVARGDFVAVPFGGGNRPQTGLVTGVRESNEDEGNLKPIHTVLDKAYSMTEEQMGIAEFLRDYTVCSTGDAVHTITPSAVFSRFDEFVVCNASFPDTFAYSSTEREIYNFVASRKTTTRDDISESFGKRGAKILQTLIKDGYLRTELSVKESLNIKFTTLYRLADDHGGDNDEFLSA